MKSLQSNQYGAIENNSKALAGRDKSRPQDSSAEGHNTTSSKEDSQRGNKGFIRNGKLQKGLGYQDRKGNLYVSQSESRLEKVHNEKFMQIKNPKWKQEQINRMRQKYYYLQIIKQKERQRQKLQKKQKTDNQKKSIEMHKVRQVQNMRQSMMVSPQVGGGLENSAERSYFGLLSRQVDAKFRSLSPKASYTAYIDSASNSRFQEQMTPKSFQNRISDPIKQEIQKLQNYGKNLKKAHDIRNMQMVEYFQDQAPFEFKSQMAMNSRKTHELLKRNNSDFNNSSSKMSKGHEPNKSVYHNDHKRLAHEMINTEAVFQMVQNAKSLQSQSIFSNNGNFLEVLESNSASKRDFEEDGDKKKNGNESAQVQKQHWDSVMSNLEQNPQFLMNILPSPNRENSGSIDRSEHQSRAATQMSGQGQVRGGKIKLSRFGKRQLIRSKLVQSVQNLHQHHGEEPRSKTQMADADSQKMNEAGIEANQIIQNRANNQTRSQNTNLIQRLAKAKHHKRQNDSDSPDSRQPQSQLQLLTLNSKDIIHQKYQKPIDGMNGIKTKHFFTKNRNDDDGSSHKLENSLSDDMFSQKDHSQQDYNVNKDFAQFYGHGESSSHQSRQGQPLTAKRCGRGINSSHSSLDSKMLNNYSKQTFDSKPQDSYDPYMNKEQKSVDTSELPQILANSNSCQTMQRCYGSSRDAIIEDGDIGQKKKKTQGLHNHYAGADQRQHGRRNNNFMTEGSIQQLSTSSVFDMNTSVDESSQQKNSNVNEKSVDFDFSNKKRSLKDVKKANDFVIRRKTSKQAIISQSTKDLGQRFANSGNILSKMVANQLKFQRNMESGAKDNEKKSLFKKRQTLDPQSVVEYQTIQHQTPQKLSEAKGEVALQPKASNDQELFKSQQKSILKKKDSTTKTQSNKPIGQTKYKTPSASQNENERFDRSKMQELKRYLESGAKLIEVDSSRFHHSDTGDEQQPEVSVRSPQNFAAVKKQQSSVENAYGVLAAGKQDGIQQPQHHSSFNSGSLQTKELLKQSSQPLIRKASDISALEPVPASKVDANMDRIFIKNNKSRQKIKLLSTKPQDLRFSQQNQNVSSSRRYSKQPRAAQLERGMRETNKTEQEQFEDSQRTSEREAAKSNKTAPKKSASRKRREGQEPTEPEMIPRSNLADQSDSHLGRNLFKLKRKTEAGESARQSQNTITKSGEKPTGQESQDRKKQRKSSLLPIKKPNIQEIQQNARHIRQQKSTSQSQLNTISTQNATQGRQDKFHSARQFSLNLKQPQQRPHAQETNPSKLAVLRIETVTTKPTKSKLLSKSNAATSAAAAASSSSISQLGPVLGPVHGGDLKIPSDLNALDISVKKLQNKAKAGFSNYELTNEKDRKRKKEESERLYALEKQKIKDYRLGKDLMAKLKEHHKEVAASTEFKQQVQSSSRADNFEAIDWKRTPFYKRVSEQAILRFNAKKDPRILSYEQIEYSINLLRYCGEGDFKQLETVQPVFEKAVATLELLMDELCIPFLFQRIINAVYKIDYQETIKILVRVKLMFLCRSKLIKIFQAVDDREQKLQNLNHVVKWGENAQTKSMDDASLLEIQEKKTRMIKTKISELDQSTKLVTELITKLLTERKIFGTKFIYDGIDYLATIKQEQIMITGTIAGLGNKMQKLRQNHVMKDFKKVDQKEVIMEETEEQENEAESPQLMGGLRKLQR